MPNEKNVYHWSETREVSVALSPDMMEKNGFNVPVKCRLKGQGNKGVTGASAELRTVNCDINYCYHKIGRMLKKFSYPEQKELLEGYLNSIGVGTLDKVDVEKNLDSWEAEIQRTEIFAHSQMTGGLSDA